ncbi:tetraspanin-31 [Coturnix japonica]|uniref:Tetraspanin 31 n=1 Tax=Coturnix japonica TaxID=93934 RepID=A0A8C2SVR7_COTJA|nr:tetraspanin-31 [Coturnix japonica]
MESPPLSPFTPHSPHTPLFPPSPPVAVCPHRPLSPLIPPQLVGLLLIAVAAWGRAVGVVSWVPLVGGVLAVGVLLLLIAAVGLVGAAHHHQVLLFFYMVVLGLLFLVQFSVSCSCLALDRGRQEQLFVATWPLLSNGTRWGLEQRLDCCGARNSSDSPINSPINSPLNHPL